MEKELEVQAEQTESNIVWSLTNDSVLITSVAYVFDRCKKHNQGKYANLSRYSLEGFVEYLMETGINAFDNGLDADIDRRNREGFTKAMAALEPPKDPTDAKQIAEYATRVQQLRRKFHIGGESKEV